MCELSADSLGREILHPKDEAEWLAWRRQDVTSTEAASLFNASPYLTHAELYFAKRDQAAPFEETERTSWGKRLQDAIAAGIIEDHDWYGRRMTEYVRLPGARMGASFDWRIHVNVGPDKTPHTADSPDDALLEIKNVDGLAFKQGWQETEFGLEAPEHIEIQVQHQLHVSGLRRAFIGALVGGNKVYLLERHYDPEIGWRLEKAVRQFWKRQAPPAFDFLRDSELIRRIYANVLGGKVVQADERIESLMQRHAEAAERMRESEKEVDALKSELLVAAGDAERVLGRDYTASLGITRRGEYVVKASEYRVVRVTKRKEK